MCAFFYHFFIEAEYDFQSKNQTIIVMDNATTGDTFCVDLSLFVLEDEILESTESFVIFLDSVEPCGSVKPGMTRVNIIDNDS